jgi:hypothetical protein
VREGRLLLRLRWRMGEHVVGRVLSNVHFVVVERMDGKMVSRVRWMVIQELVKVGGQESAMVLMR